MIARRYKGYYEMAFDSDKFNEILVALARLEGQVNRLVSDAESEKEFRKERNNNIDREIAGIKEEISELKQFRAELHGRIVVIVAVASVIVTGLVGVIIKLVK